MNDATTPNTPRSRARITRFGVAFATLLAVNAGLVMKLADTARSSTDVPTLQLVSQMSLAGDTVQHADVWAWVHPQTNKEYAFVGEWGGWGRLRLNLHIVDVSDWVNPTLVKTINSVPAFDMKTYDHYLYLVDGNSTGNDGEVWDIIDPANPVQVGGFGSHHNVWITDNGYMYCGHPGVRIYDLNPDPTSPQLVWSDSLDHGHDALVIDDRLFDFHGNPGTFIYDLSNPASPVPIGSITIAAYHHSGWTSANGQYLYLNDELSFNPTPDITVWDISNPASPVQVGSIGDPNATVHNSHRVGDYLYVSYYNSGLKVFDVATDPANPALVDEYDMSAFTGEGYDNGCWGVYPFSPTHKIYATDMDNGLFIFCFETPVGIDEATPGKFTLDQNYPNPFNPSTTIMFDLDAPQDVFLAIYDPVGRRVRTLVDGMRSAGPHSIKWDGTDDAGRQVATGVYFYRMKAAGFTDSKRMVLLK